MAENKKSFILYADIIHVVKKMPHDKIADLFITILEYVNDENPVVKDMIVELVFEPIKQQLKRDLRHWEDVKNVRSEVGKLGGINSGKTRQKKQKEANEAIASNSKQTKQRQANEAVNVNVNVTDVDYTSTLFSWNDFLNTIDFGENEFTLHATRSTNKTILQLVEYKALFLAEKKALGQLSWPNATNAKSHFISWIKKQPEVIIQRNRFLPGN